MFTPRGLLPLTTLADDLGVSCATLRRWAVLSRIPLFRCPGERDALLRQRDADRLRGAAARLQFLRPVDRELAAS